MLRSRCRQPASPYRETYMTPAPTDSDAPGQSIPALPAERTDPSPSAPGDPRMEQLRELMFGSVVRDFDARLEQLRQHLQQELTALAQRGERQLLELETRLLAQNERMQAQLHQEVDNRANAIDDMQLRWQQAARARRAEITAALQRHERDADAAEARHRAGLADLRQIQHEAIAGVREALAETRTVLDAQKLARHDLADLLAEVALRLRDPGAALGER
ncbi:hypothetical protein [Xanthomonas sontii]|nr:hypothetical protein [Xanthomonas sontii]